MTVPSSLGVRERYSKLLPTSCPYLHPSRASGLSKLASTVKRQLPTRLSLRLLWGGFHGWSDSWTPSGGQHKSRAGYEVCKSRQGGQLALWKLRAWSLRLTTASKKEWVSGWTWADSATVDWTSLNSFWPKIHRIQKSFWVLQLYTNTYTHTHINFCYSKKARLISSIRLKIYSKICWKIYYSQIIMQLQNHKNWTKTLKYNLLIPWLFPKPYLLS